MKPKILVIKLGALGDFIQALGPMAAIRAHHPDAVITLLTTAPYRDLALACPWLDDVWLDPRIRGFNLPGWWRLRRSLRQGGFQRVYDLQTSDRSSFYFRLFAPGPRPEWSGIARGCSHPHNNPDRDSLHTIARQAEQLAVAGIAHVPPPDLSWAKADLGRWSLPANYAVLVPGGSAHRPAKRWPAPHFAAVAQACLAQGLTPVLVGGPIERGIAAEIRAIAPGVLDLTGETSFTELAVLGRGARFALGNDTGPMHVLVISGAPGLVLYSDESDPALTAPRGRAVTILQRRVLADLPVSAVLSALPLNAASLESRSWASSRD